MYNLTFGCSVQSSFTLEQKFFYISFFLRMVSGDTATGASNPNTQLEVIYEHMNKNIGWKDIKAYTLNTLNYTFIEPPKNLKKEMSNDFDKCFKEFEIKM